MTYGTGVNPNGLVVSFVECSVCGAMMAQGAMGHSPSGDAADTEHHKAALAERERKSA